MNEHVQIRNAVVKYLEKLPKAGIREIYRGYNPCTSLIIFEGREITMTFDMSDDYKKEDEEYFSEFIEKITKRSVYNDNK